MECQLFLDVAVDAHIAYGLDFPEFVRQVVHISVQLAIRTAFAL